MKYYTRIEKNKVHSASIAEHHYWEEATPKKHHYTGLLLFMVVIIAGLTACGYFWLFYERSEWSTSGLGEVSLSLVQSDPEQIPEFSGADYTELNGNCPMFSQDDLQLITGEFYSPLDSLGRCGVVYAKIDSSMRPTEERGAIGMIKPSGWNQAKYEGYVNSNPPYLYNRCHLIAYALTGQNANESNLITGTRYFNVSAMLPFEEQVMRYLDGTKNHVLYRVTPYFAGNELVARGVEIEALSIEDHGRGVCFHVFVYNYQPGIEIDYLTGNSWIIN